MISCRVSDPKAKGLTKKISALIIEIKVRTITRTTSTIKLIIEIGVEVDMVTKKGNIIKRMIELTYTFVLGDAMLIQVILGWRNCYLKC